MADGSGPIIVPVAASGLKIKRNIVWFAGGGGSSEAIKQAFGADPDAALNHWPTAIAAHQRHFPATDHYCADAFDIEPGMIFPNDDIGFGWFSPDCTDFSVAKGKALRSERRRGLAWVVVDWARERRPDVIMVENVWEFTGWGPLYPDGHPQAGERIPERVGETFKEWRQAFLDLGGEFDHRKLNAADYGAATTRERLYVIIRFDGKPIVWPARTHAPRGEAAKLGLKPWVGACEVIDWSIKCPSLFLTAEEIKAGKLRVRRPLKPATLKRVARGIDRFVISAADPFIAPLTHQGGDRTHGGREPLPTVTGAHRGEFALIEPYVVPITQQTWGKDRAHDARDPLKTITTAKGGEFAAVAPQVALISNNYTSNTNGGRGDPRDPAKTFASANHHSVVTGDLAPMVNGDFHCQGCGEGNAATWWPTCEWCGHQQTGNRPAPTVAHLTTFQQNIIGTDPAEPLRTVMAGAPRHGLVRSHVVEAPFIVGTAFGDGRERAGLRAWSGMEPLRVVNASNDKAIGAAFLVPSYNEWPGQAPRCRDITRTMPTVVPGGNGGRLTVASLHQANTHDYGSSIEFPARAATGRAKQGLVLASLGRDFSTSVGRSLFDPAPTVMSDGFGKSSLITAHMAQGNFDDVGRAITDPATTFTQRATQQQLCVSSIQSYYATGIGSSCEDPVRVATAKARHGLTASWMHQANTGMVGRDLRDPASTIVLKGCTQQLIEARLEVEGGEVGRRGAVLEFLWHHFGVPTEAEMADPLATREGRLKLGLVLIKGQVWMIVDIGLRMLVPRELAGAMGLPKDFDLEHDINGRTITKTDQTHLIGNMVSPPPALALIRANCIDPAPAAPAERVAA